MKLIILGLDGMNLFLAEKCKKEMPNLNNLLQNGASGNLISTYPPMTDPAWTSLQTGKNIGNHGTISFCNYDKNLNLQIHDAENLEEDTFYEILKSKGKNCFIMNVPLSKSNNINGDILDSWFSQKDNLIKPDSLKGKFPTIKNYQVFSKKMKEKETYLEGVSEVVDSQTKIIKEIINSKDYDLMFFQISAPDWIQHQAFLDIKYDKINKKTIISKNILFKIDQLIGWIKENLNGCQFMIVSDHGFEEKSGTFFLNSWLKKEGYIFTSTKGKTMDNQYNKKERKNLNLSPIINIVKRNRILLNMAKKFYDKVRNKISLNIIDQPTIDKEKTKAICLGKNVPVIKIFSKDNSEKDKIKKGLIEKINNIPNIQAHDMQEFHKGKYSPKLGDIIINVGDYELDTFIGNKIFLKGKTAFHSKKGIFLAYGNKINKTNLDPNIYDIAPTILHMFNTKVPEDMNGKILEILKKE